MPGAVWYVGSGTPWTWAYVPTFTAGTITATSTATGFLAIANEM